MNTFDVLVISDLTLGRKVRLARIAKGLRQIDLASMTRLQVLDVSNVEMDRSVHLWKLKRILRTLELDAATGLGYGR
jgi:transcriptional regulator with XRE-family HTH domain